MKKYWESAISWFYYKRSHCCPRMTFCCMLDSSIMNQIYFLCSKRNYILWEIEGQRLHQVTLKSKLLHLNVSYICLKRECHELLNKCHVSFVACTEQKLRKFKWRQCAKNHNFLWFSHACTTKSARCSVLKFCKNNIFYGVHKLTNFH